MQDPAPTDSVVRTVRYGDMFLLNACRLLAHDAGWNEVVIPCALSRNPEIYDDLAEQLSLVCSDDASSATVHCVVTRKGLKSCSIHEFHGDARHGIGSVHDCSGVIHVLMALCKRSSYPSGTGWCSLDVSYDMEAGRLKATMHYGFEDRSESARLCTRDLLLEPIAPPEITRLLRISA